MHKERQPGIANIVSILMFGATIWLAIITLQVFRQATQQAIQSRRSADAAFTADSLTQISLDSQRASKKQSDKSDAEKLKRDTDFINKQKNGIDAQITAIQKNQENFEKSNKSFLQAVNFTPIYNTKNEMVAIRFFMSNIGSQPAKITEAYYAGLVDIPAITDRFLLYKNRVYLGYQV